MERREFIGTVATVGTVAVAGCSDSANPGDGGGGDGGGNDGGGNDGSAGGEETGTTSGPDEAALKIAQAVSTLNAVALRLNKAKENLDTPDEIELDGQTLLDGIAEARGQLDTASETASDEQTEQIATLRSLATVLENMTTVTVSIVETQPQALAERAQTEVSNENYDEALSLIREAKSTATSAQERTTTAEDELENVNADRLAAVDGVEYAKVENAVTTTATLVDAFEVVTVGYESVILGAKDLEAGRTHSENKEFGAAKEDFGKATEHFESADATLANASEDAPDDIAGRIEVANCQTTHLIAAADAFTKGAEDAENGNVVEARQHRDDGEAQLEKVNECAN